MTTFSKYMELTKDIDDSISFQHNITKADDITFIIDLITIRTKYAHSNSRRDLILPVDDNGFYARLTNIPHKDLVILYNDERITPHIKRKLNRYRIGNLEVSYQVKEDELIDFLVRSYKYNDLIKLPDWLYSKLITKSLID